MRKWLKGWRNERGFTLIELLIVVAIIGILATVAIPKISNALDDSRKKKNKADMTIVSGALDRFYSDHGFYPPKLGFLTNPTAGDPYLKKEVNFKNAYGKLYFYAVRHDGTTVADKVYNYQQYVLIDPGRTPDASASSGWASIDGQSTPEGATPSTGGYAFGTNAGGGGGQAFSTNIGSPDNPVDEDNVIWTAGTLTATGLTAPPTRTDVKTD